MLNEYQREAYLNIRGWEIEEISCQTVRIPEEFEGIYREYADIQSKDGFKLENYKGKEVLRCLYRVLNYGGDSEVTAELLLYNDELISAALFENKQDGFIKPFILFLKTRKSFTFISLKHAVSPYNFQIPLSFHKNVQIYILFCSVISV